MKEIFLTQGKTALIDAEDFDRVNKFKWQAQVRRSGGWYARRQISRKPSNSVYLHQFIMPGIGRLDHRDGDGLNNQKKNLRPATASQNTINSSKLPGCTSKFKGVHWSKKACCWMARIGIHRQRIYLGIFESEEAAARAYDLAAVRLHGEFARLNFPIT